MCGICGQYVHEIPAGPNQDAIRRMTKALIHRGPDDEGLWSNEHVGLAARRLSIQDVESGHQPMVSKDGQWSLALNGEIYNTQVLRKDLEAGGVTCKTRCDTEVAVEAFARWGEGALDRFNGMFAIAAYHLDSNTLLLARDRMGIKPLFYSEVSGGVLFSSELKSLMESEIVLRDIDYDSVDAFLAYQYIPAPSTIYRGAKKLLPGHVLRVHGKKTELRRYWSIDYSTDKSWTLDSASERFWEILTDSVKIRLLSDVPLGAFLSGGIDSSAVVAAMSEVSSDPIKTFSIGFEDAASNELPYARVVAEHFGTDHTEEILNPNWQSIFPSLLDHFGEPFGDSSALPMYLVSKTARESVTVALSGDGGDENWAGYSWTHMNDRVNSYRAIPSSLRRLIGLGMNVMPDRPFWKKVRRYNNDSFLNYRESFRRRQLTFDDEQRTQLFNPFILDSLVSSTKIRYEAWMDGEWEGTDQNWMLAQDTHRYLPDDILTKVDRMSMAVSLEARVPLLDHRMVEFAATVPYVLKYADGKSKRIPKNALKGKVPDTILGQRKQGFSIPVNRWFREDWKTLFTDCCLSEASCLFSIANTRYIESLFQEHQNGQEDHGHRLWSLLVLEQWLQSNS